MPTPPVIQNGNDPDAIASAAELIRQGQLVAMPTETVYGLAGSALDPNAVARIFAAKARPSFDPLIVHAASIDQARSLAEFDPISQRLAQAFWPGPMTLVLPRAVDENGNPIVPDLVTAGLNRVGVRVPDHPVALALLRAVDRPLAAPSANRFGSISPTQPQHVVDELGDSVSLVLDGGPCQRGIESTVLRVTDGRVQVLRLGALRIDAIEQLLGEPIEVCPPTSSPGRPTPDQPKPAPGMVERHYAPHTPMVLLDSPMQRGAIDDALRVGVLGFGDVPTLSNAVVYRSLSQSGDLTEAAANLFRLLRELDAMGLDQIVALKLPEHGLGRAINDRLQRGSARSPAH